MSKDNARVAYYQWGKLAESDKPCIGSGQFSSRDAARFWAKVAPSGDCWLWQGATFPRNGYGSFSVAAGKPRGHQAPHYAHRVAWELANGAIPAGQHVLHSCDVPACVNPAHLFLGTHRNNMEDAARKGRLHVSRPNGRTVSDESVSQIRALAASGVRRADLARQFGVSKTFVTLLLNGTRRQLPAPRTRTA